MLRLWFSLPTQHCKHCRSTVMQLSYLVILIRSSSLLQEPEAKWKWNEWNSFSASELVLRMSCSYGSTAEATFVGLALWDLYGALVSLVLGFFWDKQHEDATPLEDVNELTQLWHSRPNLRGPGRATVLLKIVYKSPTTTHVFSFSADDPYLFSSIPPQDSTLIRTQVDFQGWAIETLFPSTTQLTLLEQSDIKGWSNKAACHKPRSLRLLALVTLSSSAAVPRGAFRVEYEGSENRRAPSTIPEDSVNESTVFANSRTMHTIECEIRCDMDTWASVLDVVDPPRIVSQPCAVTDYLQMAILRTAQALPPEIHHLNPPNLRNPYQCQRGQRLRKSRVRLPAFGRLVDTATTTTQQVVAAMAPGDGGAPSASQAPMQRAAEALQWM
ncbi:hypothetical protein EDB19DRAFT_1966036 [Suillus lakei]|nr:hypothetical protein EDB19DRAFT_1966036 [Suillus lakei]